MNPLSSARAAIALLPCPFCGGAELELWNTHTPSFSVKCLGCDAEATGESFSRGRKTKNRKFHYDPDASADAPFDARTLGELPPNYQRAAESAITAWNRRALGPEAGEGAVDDWREDERLSLLGLREALEGFEVRVERTPLLPLPATYLELVTVSCEFQPGIGHQYADAIRAYLAHPIREPTPPAARRGCGDAERLDWLLARITVDRHGISLPCGRSKAAPASESIAAIDAALQPAATHAPAKEPK